MMDILYLVALNQFKASQLRGFFAFWTMNTLFASFYLAHSGTKASRVFIVENSKADWLTRMGYLYLSG